MSTTEYTSSADSPLLPLLPLHSSSLIFLSFFPPAVADIPGLVPNAHLNKGLGHSFLKHIQRCSILLLVLDASSPNTTMVAQLQHLQRELQLYDNQLLDSAHLIVANKMDTWGELSKQDSNVCGPFEEELHKLQSDTGLPIIPVSALLQWNILPLKEAIFRACN